MMSFVRVSISVKITVAVILFAAFAGFFGFTLLFSELGPGETFFERILVIGLFYATGGAIIGFFSPSRWMLSLLFSWGAFFMGTGSLMATILLKLPTAFLTAWFFLPVFVSVLGARAGATLRGKFVYRRQRMPRLEEGISL